MPKTPEEVVVNVDGEDYSISTITGNAIQDLQIEECDIKRDSGKQLDLPLEWEVEGISPPRRTA